MRPIIELSVSGTVKKIVTVTPQYVRFSGTAGSRLQQTVAIIPEKGYSFKILNTTARDGRNIRYRMQEEQTDGQIAYRLTVENLKAEQGRYTDRIELTTDSRYKPKIHIHVLGQIRAPKPMKTN